MRRILASLIALTLVLAFPAMPSTRAQDVSTSYIVQIRAGTCADPGDGLTQLETLTFADSNPVGAAEAAMAASSYSVAPLALDALTSSATAIVVLDGESNVLVACGEIGGVFGTDGALSIGLRPAGDSGLSGIAYLAPSSGDPAQTGISTFLALTGAGAGDAAEPAVPTMDAADYSSMINNQLTVLVGSLQRIDALFGQADASDSSWVSQVGAELFLWKLLYRVAQDVESPAAFADFDEQYLGALALLDSAATDIMQGIQTGDESLLTSASDKIQDAVTALRGLQSAQPSATPTAATPMP